MEGGEYTTYLVIKVFCERNNFTVCYTTFITVFTLSWYVIPFLSLCLPCHGMLYHFYHCVYLVMVCYTTFITVFTLSWYVISLLSLCLPCHGMLYHFYHCVYLVMVCYITFITVFTLSKVNLTHKLVTNK